MSATKPMKDQNGAELAVSNAEYAELFAAISRGSCGGNMTETVCSCECHIKGVVGFFHCIVDCCDKPHAVLFETDAEHAAAFPRSTFEEAMARMYPLKNSGDGWEQHVMALYEQAEREGRLCPKCRGVLGGPVHANVCGSIDD